MDLLSFFSVVGGDYNEVMSRLLKEERIIKYLNKFKDSTEYAQLLDALEKEDWELAFRMSHSLKGMCANLGLGKLRASSSELCELLRPCKKPEISYQPLLDAVKADYATVLDAISNL